MTTFSSDTCIFIPGTRSVKMLTIILNGVKKQQAVDKLIHVPRKYGCLSNSPPQEAFCERDLSLKKSPNGRKGHYIHRLAK